MRFLTGHAFLRKHNAYVKYRKKPNQVIDEVKCRMCGVSNEEPAHIIKECKAFSVERFEEFWMHTDKEWSVAGGTPKIIVVKTSRMTGRLRVYIE